VDRLYEEVGRLALPLTDRIDSDARVEAHPASGFEYLIAETDAGYDDAWGGAGSHEGDRLACHAQLALLLTGARTPRPRLD
jgi:hypothetical protein